MPDVVVPPETKIAPARTDPAGPVGAARTTSLIEQPRNAPMARRRTVRRVLIAVAIAALVAVGGWYLVPPAVEVATPVLGPAVEAVYATGTVEAPVTIPIAGRAAGRIAEILADEGDTVAAGEVLVRFEDEDAQESLRQLSAQEVFARQAFERVDQLLARGAVAQSARDRAYADWQAAQAAAARAAVEAGYRRITAPSEGRIVRRDGEAGQVVTAGQAILWLARPDPLRISSAVDEEDVARVAVGQPVLIRADAFAGQVFNGRVQSITPMGDAVARSYRVRIEMPEDTPLLMGMTAETNIIIRESDKALLVPTSAVENGRVWKVVDGRLAEQPVKTGVRGAERTEIVEGLSLEDRIVVAPGSSLKAGDRVREKAAAAK
jgi:RND family efflux transporter MFP subunit